MRGCEITTGGASAALTSVGAPIVGPRDGVTPRRAKRTESARRSRNGARSTCFAVRSFLSAKAESRSAGAALFLRAAARALLRHPRHYICSPTLACVLL